MIKRRLIGRALAALDLDELATAKREMQAP